MGYRTKIKPDYNLIESLIPAGARVLDLGCGDGTLLSLLQERKKVKGIGIDIYSEGLNECLKKGLSVLQLDLNNGLASFKSGSFDYVILNMTLQATYNPLLLIKEMVRVGHRAIVGFPNFGHWKLVLSLLLKERMPKNKTLPYEWYNTPNIRLMTIKDFRILCRENGIRIIGETFLGEDGEKTGGRLISWRAAEGVFEITARERCQW
ncbi:MAG: methionine biosynthesis protein MetW [Candidatus Margulisbacteria bacterium]|nr:methionine biosynthesis protein MetW [Candidatus Margulisiibacteriota bacterium]MBU1616857.1 methionine biosynthesis protein MetW [Candidatus Margulisiibacteriota bacterium]